MESVAAEVNHPAPMEAITVEYKENPMVLSEVTEFARDGANDKYFKAEVKGETTAAVTASGLLQIGSQQQTSAGHSKLSALDREESEIKQLLEKAKTQLKGLM